LMNLLNGLAVSDTSKIRDSANVIGLLAILEIITYWEAMLLGDPGGYLRHSWLPLEKVKKFGVPIWKKYFCLISKNKIFQFKTQPEKTNGHKKNVSEFLALLYFWESLGQKDEQFRMIEGEGEEDTKVLIGQLYLSKRIIYKSFDVMKQRNQATAEESDENSLTTNIQEQLKEMNTKINEQKDQIQHLVNLVEKQNKKLDALTEIRKQETTC
jgi:hypothetical protein